MATTYTDNGGGAANGSDLEFTFTFPVIQTEDVKVALNGVTQATTKYAVNLSSNPTKITFNNTSVDSSVQESSGAPKSGVTVRVFRQTTVGKTNGDEDPKAVFAAGSSIRAIDLNANQEQALYAIHELQNQPVKTGDVEDGAIISSKILDGTIVEADLANSAVTQNKLANNSVGTPELINGSVNSDKILDGTIVNADISSSAAIDASKIVSATGSVAGTMSATDKAKLDGIESGAKDDQTAAEIKTLLQSNKITDSEIATGTLDNRYFTETELTDGALDGRYFTETESDARYFNVSTGDTIKDGDTFPDNDTTIATTAAINDRIIDLVDDVGGFRPIPNQNSFPSTNPDVNGNAGTIVSVQAATTALSPQSGTTLTLPNGRGSGLAVIITGVSSTIPSGFGFLVETTSTDHTYTFHRLSPKATEVTTVAGKATEIGRLGTADAVADMAILGTADVVADLNTLGTADVVSDLNTLGTADVVADMNTLAVTSVVNNMDTVATNVANVNTTAGSISNVNTTAGSIANVNTVAGSIANVNTVGGAITNVNNVGGSIANVNSVASNLASVNSFANTYRIGADNPTTSLDTGDLFFNTTSDSLKVYTGSAWVDGVTTTGDFALKTGNTFTGSNIHNDNVKALFGTGSDLEIFHDGAHSFIKDVGTGALQLSGGRITGRTGDAASEYLFTADANGAVELYFDNVKKFETTTNGVEVTGDLRFDVSVSGGTIRLGDDQKLFLGGGNDLKIYHNGTNSILSNTTGALKLLLNNDEDAIVANQNGAVELFHNNVKKFETTSSGGTVTGALTATDGFISEGGVVFTGANYNANWVKASNLLRFQDNAKATFGASDDLEIYHDGSNSYLAESGTGDLIITGTVIRPRTDQFTLNNAANTENMIQAVADGAVSLFHNGSKKIETTSGGVDITGALTLNGSALNTDLVSDTSPQLGGNLDSNNRNIDMLDSSGSTQNRLKFGNGQDLQIYHDGTKSVINEVGAGWLEINTSNLRVQNSGANETLLYATENGSVELFYDNSKKFETSSTGGILRGTTWTFLDNTKAAFGNGDDLKIYHDGTNSRIENTTGKLYLKDDYITFVRQADDSVSFQVYEGGATDLYFNHNKKFETHSNGCVFTGSLYGLDNHKIELGNSNDLQIYHSGHDSFIKDTGVGGIRIDSNQTVLRNAAGTEHIIATTENGNVELFYDNSKKFETANYGAQVSGQLYVSDYIYISNGADLYLEDNGVARFGNSNDLKIYHDGSHNQILAAENQNIIIRGADSPSSTPSIQLNPRGNHTGLKVTAHRGVEAYYDNGKKLETTSYGTKITGYQSSSSYAGFHVRGTNAHHGFGTAHSSGITTYDTAYYSPIPMFSSKNIDHGSSYLTFPSYAGGNYIKFTAPVAGLYQLELIASVESHYGGDFFGMSWEINTTNTSSSASFMNNGRGVISVFDRTNSDSGTGTHFSTTIWMDTNDYAVLYSMSAQAVRFKTDEYYVRGHLIH